MKKYTLWALALIVCGGAAEMARVRMASDAQQNVAGDQQTNSAAFRDGSYLGRLAAEQSDAPHVAIGRWATDADRDLFVTGYREAYSQSLTQNLATRPDQGDLAAFRDGLYLGKLDSERGSAWHVALGRWSKASDQAAFAQGYNRAYGDGYSARAEQRKIMRQAVLVR